MSKNIDYAQYQALNQSRKQKHPCVTNVKGDLEPKIISCVQDPNHGIQLVLSIDDKQCVITID